jgi:hypothetical protein
MHRRPVTLAEPYQPRPVEPLGIWHLHGWSLKAYGIAYRGAPRPALVAAARGAAIGALAAVSPRHVTYGVGFVGIHEGRTETQVFLDLWANENELLHTTWVAPLDQPEGLRPAPADQCAVCVWDLGLQAFERQAWMDHVLCNPHGPSVESYLVATMRGAI